MFQLQNSGRDDHLACEMSGTVSVLGTRYCWRPVREMHGLRRDGHIMMNRKPTETVRRNDWVSEPLDEVSLHPTPLPSQGKARWLLSMVTHRRSGCVLKQFVQSVGLGDRKQIKPWNKKSPTIFEARPRDPTTTISRGLLISVKIWR